MYAAAGEARKAMAAAISCASAKRPAGTVASIVALTTSDVQYRRLALVWGVTPVLMESTATTDELIDRVEALLAQRNLARSGDHVVITMGVPVGAGLSTNLLKIHQMS